MNPMIRNLLTGLLLLTLLNELNGQTGGEGVYSFLQLTNSAKAAALGGIQVALPDPDPELLLQNPALLTPGMNHLLSVNYARYLAGIGFGYGAYARDLGKYGMAAIGIQFVDYGQFVAADETGVITGSFSASEYALNMTYAKTFGTLFTAGISLKPIYSHLENYKSFGLAVDVGLTHHASDQLTTVAICLRQLGAQFSTYYDGGPHENLDWSLQVGCTHQLQHAPLRLSITAYDLNRWNGSVTTTDPNGISNTEPGKSLLPSVMRHLSLGAELFPEQSLTLRAGYNYRRYADLAIPDQSGMTGFTAGVGIRLTAIRLNYALSGYAQSGLVHNFSFTLDLSRLVRKSIN